MDKEPTIISASKFRIESCYSIGGISSLESLTPTAARHTDTFSHLFNKDANSFLTDFAQDITETPARS